MFNFLIIWNRIYFDIFINKSANRFLIYSYFITSGIFLIILILLIVKRFGKFVELALYKLCQIKLNYSKRPRKTPCS